jgi:hypothetical protein
MEYHIDIQIGKSVRRLVQSVICTVGRLVLSCVAWSLDKWNQHSSIRDIIGMCAHGRSTTGTNPEQSGIKNQAIQ